MFNNTAILTPIETEDYIHCQECDAEVAEEGDTCSDCSMPWGEAMRRSRISGILIDQQRAAALLSREGK